MRRLAFAVALVVTAAASSMLFPQHAFAQAQCARWCPPVNAPVADPFRPAITAYGPGNFGIDYSVVAGTPVHAAAQGKVVFAGRVAGRLFVTLSHTGNLRTSYGPLASTTVQAGDVVMQNDVIGLSGNAFHFGVRQGAQYIDPAPFLRGNVHLVPLGGTFTGGKASVGTTTGGPAISDNAISAGALAWLRGRP